MSKERKSPNDAQLRELISELCQIQRDLTEHSCLVRELRAKELTIVSSIPRLVNG